MYIYIYIYIQRERERGNRCLWNKKQAGERVGRAPYRGTRRRPRDAVQEAQLRVCRCVCVWSCSCPCFGNCSCISLSINDIRKTTGGHSWSGHGRARPEPVDPETRGVLILQGGLPRPIGGFPTKLESARRPRRASPGCTAGRHHRWAPDIVIMYMLSMSMRVTKQLNTYRFV